MCRIVIKPTQIVANPGLAMGFDGSITSGTSRRIYQLVPTRRVWLTLADRMVRRPECPAPLWWMSFNLGNQRYIG